MAECKEEMQIFQRCVGYYSSRQTVNKGKLEEIKMRKAYDLNKAESDIDRNRCVGLSALTAEGER